ncbi:MAG: hypothetical protein KGO96_10040 [Elusimicrobia bacterium]|nr:hypothetical protein [Elusimicrobiota bacterium]
MSSRQTQVGVLPAPAVEGNFADMNPRFTVLGGPGGLVAGSAGVYVGRFAWLSYQGADPDNAPTILNSFGFGAPDGLIPRPGQQSLITQYLSDSTLLIQQGAPVWAMSSGGLWVKNTGASYATIGLKAYANLNNGQVTFAATGSASTVSLTSSSIAAGTAVAGTASILGNVLTVTAISAGTIYPGTILTGPSGVATGTQVVAQLSGTTGGIGTYALSIGEQSVASGTLAGTYGVLTVGGGGPPVYGSVLSGSGVTTGTTTWGQLTASTYVVSPSQSASSTTITATTNVETKWYSRSGGGAGELVKISDITQ